MSTTPTTSGDRVLARLDGGLGDLEALYKDLHAHPELSVGETRTAALAADRLRAAGYQVTTGIGGTGAVGLLRNGDGPTVMLRADIDALPVEEATGLPYPSQARAADREAFGSDWRTPSVFWFVGGTDPQRYAQAKAANRLHELPVNHSPKFAPVLHPTLRTGVETLVVAARAWLPAHAGAGSTASSALEAGAG